MAKINPIAAPGITTISGTTPSNISIKLTVMSKPENMTYFKRLKDHQYFKATPIKASPATNSITGYLTGILCPQ